MTPQDLKDIIENISKTLISVIILVTNFELILHFSNSTAVMGYVGAISSAVVVFWFSHSLVQGNQSNLHALLDKVVNRPVDTAVK